MERSFQSSSSLTKPYKKLSGTQINAKLDPADYLNIALSRYPSEGCKHYILNHRDYHKKVFGTYCGFSASSEEQEVVFQGYLKLQDKTLCCTIKHENPSTTHIFHDNQLISAIKKTTEATEDHQLCPTFRVYADKQLLATIPVDTDKNLQKIAVHKTNTCIEFPLQSYCSSTGNSLLTRYLRRMVGKSSQKEHAEHLLTFETSNAALTKTELDILLFSILIIKSEFIPHDFPGIKF